MWTTIQNVVFPTDNDPDLLPLYADPEAWTAVGDETFRVSNDAHIENVLSRHSTRVRSGKRTSFASYFNAFPASYWQHWTKVREIRLSLTTSGHGSILVFRSNALGVQQRVDSQHISGTSTHSEFVLPVNVFGDGGWYWFDIVADEEDVILERGEWETDIEPRAVSNASIGITTMNKPDYCVRTLSALSDEQTLLENIDTVYVVDQGTDKVEDREEFPTVSSKLGNTLAIINQPNLGGSGGFSRAMAETLEKQTSGFVLLLDDDVQVEPEGIYRAIQFGRFAKRPTIVGGHMFDLLDKPVLHAFAEVIDMHPFMWKPLFEEQVRHDFRSSNLRQTAWMHARMDADYNGWWMCLIPIEVVRDVGLSLPMFIKWDDSEYGLRAREAGFNTVSLPGAALWHVSWVDKDDSIDWQAYFHARNRILAALLHSPFKRSGGLISNSRKLDIKHLLSMQYYAVELRHRALRDLLSGPKHLHRTMASKLSENRALAKSFTETKTFLNDADLPLTNEGKRVYPPKQESSPAGARLAAFTAISTLRHWATRPEAQNVTSPQVELSKRDATWWRVPHFDSALISTADGRGKNWYRRDRTRFRALLKESAHLHTQLERRWAELAQSYRSSLGELTSLEEWKKTFAGRDS